jgi:hypothetical protein
MNKFFATLNTQDQARLAELSTFFECRDNEALLSAIRFAHNALCGSPDSVQHRAVVKTAFGSVARQTTTAEKYLFHPQARSG